MGEPGPGDDRALWDGWPSAAHASAGGDGAGSGARRHQTVVTVVVGALLLVAGVGIWLAGWSAPAGDALRGAGAEDDTIPTTEGPTWSRVPVGEADVDGLAGQLMHSVIAGGPGLVAVGTGALGPEGVAAVWTSPDGHTWSRVAHDEAVFGGRGRRAMRSVVAGGPGLVAVGEDTGLGAAAVWTSPDGHTWSRVAHDEAVLGRLTGPPGPGAPGAAMSSVTTGGPGLVAVGSDFDEDVTNAAVWTSADGHTWSRVADDDAVFGGPGKPMMASVTAGGPGLVAVGELHAEGAAAVWTSPEGDTWSRVAHDEEVFGGPGGAQMWSVATGGPGLIAVGADSGPEATPTVWIAE